MTSLPAAVFVVSTQGKSCGLPENYMFFVFLGDYTGSLCCFCPSSCVSAAHAVPWPLSAGVLQRDLPVHSGDVHELLRPQVDGHTNPH